MTEQAGETRVERTISKFDQVLDELAAAKPFSKARYQPDLYSLASELLESEAGIRKLYERAARFQHEGVFHGGPWDHMLRLQPALVEGCLKGEGQYPTIEALSELRILALATGRWTSEEMNAAEARKFLREVVALNLEFLFPSGDETEEGRIKRKRIDKARRLFALVGSELALDGLRYEVVDEIGLRLAQRPIDTDRIRQLIELSERLPGAAGGGERDEERERLLEQYFAAVTCPTRLARETGSPAAYRNALQAGTSAAALEAEIDAFASALQQTGIGNPFHAVLLRKVVKDAPELIPRALGINPQGAAEYDATQEFAVQLIKMALVPTTASAIYGYSKLLERGLLSRGEVAGGLDRLVDLDLATEVRRRLLARHPRSAGVTANSALVAGAISVLGQPLGISQGSSPTCQAARGLSLWSQHAPGYLLELLATAARDNLVEMQFEGLTIDSSKIVDPAGPDDGLNVDAVSAVLVPHLNRIYGEMLRRAHGRGEDPHKWVNPSLYGRWVARGFSSAFDAITGRVGDFEGMVRRFYATHHPSFNDGYKLVYPNPVGIFVTDVHGNLLGPHAVSLLRVAATEGGDDLRAYFFNPNHEGRQNWGQGVMPTVSGHEEQPGESSLPFHHFASRLYAFHYNPYEEGDAFAVPHEYIEEITQMARESWGQTLWGASSAAAGS